MAELRVAGIQHQIAWEEPERNFEHQHVRVVELDDARAEARAGTRIPRR